MATKMRSQQRFNQNALASQQMPAQIIPDAVRTFALSGENITWPLSRLPDGVSRLVQNLMLRYGKYLIRDSTLVIGAIAGNPVVHAQEVILANGTSLPVRFTTNGIAVFTVGAWTAATGAFTTTNTAAFSITGWGDTVVFANEANGIYQLAFTAGYPVTVITAVTGIIHLATFASRVIVSFPDLIQWSVKNSSTDYAGLGSGSESLKSSPGGKTDQQTAVVPISDQTALVIRTQSFWIMSTSGDFDAPFSFNVLDQGRGSRYPRTCVAIPRGAMCLGELAVWKVTLDGGVVDVGMPIASALASTPGLLRLATATFDAKNQEYRLSIPTTSQTVGRVFRYSLDNNLWTEDSYPFPIRSITSSLYTQGLAIDELVGSIDDLQGAIDDLTTGINRLQIMFAMNDTRKYVAQDNSAHSNDPLRDVNYAGSRVAGMFRLETGLIKKGRSIDKTAVVQLQLEYFCEGSGDILFEYSDNGGVSWNSISTVSIVANTLPQVISVDYSLDRDDLMFAVSCAASPSISLIDLFALVGIGGMKVDAS